MNGTGPDRRARTVSLERSMERAVPINNIELYVFLYL